MALAVPGTAAALPQQQGSVDLLHQADGQWQGPGEADGSSATGSSVTGLPDVFRTGRGALAIGAPEADPGGRAGAGSVYVVAGQAGSATVDLTALSGRGYRIDGGLAGDGLGAAVASLRLAGGDPGLAVGVPDRPANGRYQAGAVYVIDLRRLRADIDLSAPRLPRSVVAVIAGARVCAQAGSALADAGPVADRSDDLLVGAPGDDPGGCAHDLPSGTQGGDRGAAYLVLGSRLHGHIDLAHAGGAVAAFTGGTSGDRAGAALSGVVGRSGRASGSFLIGAPDASPAGRPGAGVAYLIGGRIRGGTTVSLAAPPSGSTSFLGAAADEALGSALTSTSDFVAGRANGTAELALAAPQASPRGRTHAGVVYLRPAAREPRTVDLAAGSGAAVTVRSGSGEIDGAEAGDEAGYSLAGVGDLNGDGRADLAIGAPFVNSQTGTDRIDNGAVYVIYGGTGGSRIDLGTLHSRGYVAFGARNSDEAGTAVAGVANESGDGRSDLLIGAPFAENTFSSLPSVGGAVYAVLGFGPPALSYPHGGVVKARVGRRLEALRPRVRSTGRPAFSVTPALPRGLALDPRTGAISGVPRVRIGPTPYTVQLSDLAGIADATVVVSVR